jgi:hypothetical protein
MIAVAHLTLLCFRAPRMAEILEEKGGHEQK